LYFFLILLLQEIFKYINILDFNKLYSNDICNIYRIYGIEAAYKVIIEEMKNVFKVYGISVDIRHLSLIADYMTNSGTIQPFNRKGMESCASTLQQMSFETAMSALNNAVIQGK
jgi:DNA-directed RNA polymerase I subunit RPA1